MKAKLLTLILLLSTFAGQLIAQAPQLVNYQSVVRNANGNPVTAGTVVSLRFIIHDLTPTGTPLFTETHSDTANQFGLITVKLGSSASLAPINWGNGAKFLSDI